MYATNGGKNIPGGSGGIRTPEGFDTLAAFQATALDHYATLPYRRLVYHT